MRDFNHTVNVLVKAYLDDTLKHGSCTACAVGNMVAESTGRKIIEGEYGLSWNVGYACWDNVFVTALGIHQPIDMESYYGEAKKQIDSTGYSVKELAMIEAAFESVRLERPREEWNMKSKKDEFMYSGLMRVLDTLATIHGISLEQKSVAKAMFVKETLNQ